MTLEIDKQYQLIQKQFLCSCDLRLINWADILNHISSQQDQIVVQDLLLNCTVLHPLVVKYSLKKSYIQFFLKSFIQQLETHGIEVSDNVYTFYCTFLQNSVNEAEDFHFRHFVINDSIVTVKESTNIISQGTTGLCSWQAALALAEWCLLNINNIRGKHILELGSGAGLTGISVAKTCQPASYCFSDYHSAVLQLLKENIYLNSFVQDKLCIGDTPVEVIKLNWDNVGSTEIKHTHCPNLLLAADVVYDDALFPPLLNTLQHYLRTVGTQAIIACTVRDQNTLDKFLELLAESKLIVEEQPPIEPKVFVFSLNTPIKVFLLKSLN